MPTDLKDRSPINMEFYLEHSTQHQQQSYLHLQFGSRNTGSDRNI
jgi:hypothetical protein